MKPAFTAREDGSCAQPRFISDRVTLSPGVHLGELQQALFAAAGPAVDWLVGLGALAFVALGG